MTESVDRIESAGCQRLFTVSVAEQRGILTARQRARQLARLIGFDPQDQIRIATATSEIARNAVQYGRDGRVEFLIQLHAETPLFVIRVTDKGPGLVEREAILEGRYRSQTGMGLGLSGTRRLMDRFSLESTPGRGTIVTFGKLLPQAVANKEHIASLSEQLAKGSSQDASDEIRQQSHELLVALDLVCKLETELEKRRTDMARLNQELEETNRGVVALYAELDEPASALRQADEVKTRFLSYMSHEFRTPRLNSILALSDLLLARTDGDLTAEQEKRSDLCAQPRMSCLRW